MKQTGSESLSSSKGRLWFQLQAITRTPTAHPCVKDTRTLTLKYSLVLCMSLNEMSWNRSEWHCKLTRSIFSFSLSAMYSFCRFWTYSSNVWPYTKNVLPDDCCHSVIRAATSCSTWICNISKILIFLWISHSNIESEQSMWHSSVRRVCGMPNHTHCALIPFISRRLPLYDKITKWMLPFSRNFVWRVTTSFVARYADRHGHIKYLLGWDIFYCCWWYVVTVDDLWFANPACISTVVESHFGISQVLLLWYWKWFLFILIILYLLTAKTVVNLSLSYSFSALKFLKWLYVYLMCRLHNKYIIYPTN